MSEKLIQLAERRAVLIARAEEERKELSQALAPWGRPLAVMNQGAEAIRSLKKHPELVAGLAVFAAVLRPWRLVRWLPPGWALWRIARVALGAKRLLRGL